MDRINYTRWSALYLQDILDLDKTHPEVYREFKEGKFTVKQTDTPLTSIATDQGLETTGNRSKKNASGIIGSTRQTKFVTRWELVHPEELAMFNLFRKITEINNDNYEYKNHHESGVSYTTQTEQIMQKMIKFAKEHSNPFAAGSQPLNNIFTQELVSADVQNRLINIFETGIENYRNFFMERFIFIRTKIISDAIKNINLPSFQPIQKNTQKQNKKNTVTDVKYGERLIQLAKLRNYDLRTLLTYELILTMLYLMTQIS